jgi:hypothetical protein
MNTLAWTGRPAKPNRRGQFPDDSRAWNTFGGITTILDDGDLLIGGAFVIKRMIDAPAA